MTRTAAALLAAALTIPGLAAAQPGVEDLAVEAARPPEQQAPAQDAAAEAVEAAEDTAAEAGEAAESEEYAEEEYDEEEYEGESFCGGGEESVVDMAYYEMQDGNLARARSMLVTALREGGVDDWQRGYALATLAEVQLRLRQYGQAVVNYRKALRIDADGVGAAARVGLATALYLRGIRAAAHEEAVLARDEVCADRYSMAACYGAQWIIARTSRDATERTEATETLGRIRADHPDLAESLDEVEDRLERRRRRPRAGGEPRS